MISFETISLKEVCYDLALAIEQLGGAVVMLMVMRLRQEKDKATELVELEAI